MKNVKTMIMVMIFAMLGTNFADAKTYDLSKSECKKSNHEWRNGKCRDKVKKKKNKTKNNQPIMGGNSSTYAPQVFNPTSPYNGAGLVGNYFSSNGIATIHDPSGQNDADYSFENVQGVSGNVRPVGLIEIGSFKDPNFKPSLVYCSGCPNGTIKLFGSLMQEDDAA